MNNHKIANPDCALGFAPGEKLATVDAEKLADLYFARNGGLIFRTTPGGTCWAGWSQPVEAIELARRSVKTSAGVR